jgi:hypothetical protein
MSIPMLTRWVVFDAEPSGWNITVTQRGGESDDVTFDKRDEKTECWQDLDTILGGIGRAGGTFLY